MADGIRISKLTFIVVPSADELEAAMAINTARQGCRVAHLLGFVPVSPLLFFGSYLSQGEYFQQAKGLAEVWLKRSDRIWLHFVNEGDERLDFVTYSILEDNNKLGSRINNLSGRRPVYKLHRTGDESVGYVPVAMSRDDVQEILDCNLTVSLSKMQHA